MSGETRFKFSSVLQKLPALQMELSNGPRSMSAAFGPTQALWLLQFELIYLRLFRSISALGPGTEARVCPDWQVSVLQEPLCVRHKLQSSLSFKSQMCYLHAVHLALLDFFLRKQKRNTKLIIPGPQTGVLPVNSPTSIQTAVEQRTARVHMLFSPLSI